MDVVLYMASSLDGFIAKEDGSEDFLSSVNWEEFVRLAEDGGGFVVGRRTFEIVSGWGHHSYGEVDAERFVVSNDSSYDISEEYNLVQSPREAVIIAERMGVDRLIVTGGSSLNYSFIELGLLDKVILNIEPCLLGGGLRLFDGGCFVKRLELDTIKELEGDIVQLSYDVRDI